MDVEIKDKISKLLLKNYHKYLKKKPDLFTGGVRSEYIQRIMATGENRKVFLLMFIGDKFNNDITVMIAHFMIELVSNNNDIDLSCDYKISKIDKEEAGQRLCQFVDERTSKKIGSYLGESIYAVMCDTYHHNLFSLEMGRAIYIKIWKLL